MNLKKLTQAFVVGIIIKRVRQRPSVLRSIAAHELILPDAVTDEKFVDISMIATSLLQNSNTFG